MVAPEETNRPVPMEPPMAIMFRWRLVSVRLRCPEGGVAAVKLALLFEWVMGNLLDLHSGELLFLL
ncbi:hypothetical protein PRtIB026_A45480 [Pseudomonas sp. RtIB026]|nr:hypothetical protein PRtIB026_A45480 [Pseudomonas sp. RtIB026]